MHPYTFICTQTDVQTNAYVHIYTYMYTDTHRNREPYIHFIEQNFEIWALMKGTLFRLVSGLGWLFFLKNKIYFDISR